MMMKHYDFIVIGASALGISAAADAVASGLSVLVLERTVVCGREYGAALYAAPIDPGADSVLLTAMREHSLVAQEGTVHIIPTDGILAGILKESGADVLLSCETVSIENRDGMFAFTVFGEDGLLRFTAKRVLDTTAEGAIAAGATGCYQKFLSATLAVSENSLTYVGEMPEQRRLPSRLGGCFVDRGCFAGEYYLRFPLDPSDDYKTARRKLVTHWERVRAAFRPYEIAAFAPLFCYRFDAPLRFVEKGITYIPSASYSNIVAAFEGGHDAWK